MKKPLTLNQLKDLIAANDPDKPKPIPKPKRRGRVKQVERKPERKHARDFRCPHNYDVWRVYKLALQLKQDKDKEK